jgi:hypothetical protein
LVRTSLAGPIADELFVGRELDVTGGDYQVAHAAAKEVAEDMSRTIDQVMASARADVDALIQRHTSAIEQVSRALLAARWHEMDGEEASTIFGQGGRGARECP